MSTMSTMTTNHNESRLELRRIKLCPTFPRSTYTITQDCHPSCRLSDCMYPCICMMQMMQANFKIEANIPQPILFCGWPHSILVRCTKSPLDKNASATLEPTGSTAPRPW